MQPIFPSTEPAAPQPDANDPTGASALDTLEAAPARRDWRALLLKYWWALLLLCGVGSVGALLLYAQSLAADAEKEKEPIAAASENIEQVVPETDTRREAPPAPTEVMDRKAAAGQAEKKPTPRQLASGFATDSAQLVALYKKQTAAEKPKPAPGASSAERTEEVTVRDEDMGMYRNERRTRSRQYDEEGAGEYRRARRDEAPARAAYWEGPPRPKSDPFGTVKVSNGGASGEEQDYGGSSSAQSLTPDVFYKCVINGAQSVRSGSVVILRLMEDAVVSDVTFSKNLVFAGTVDVQTNRVMFRVNRLGPTRVQASIFDYNYMPGIMIDPEKRQVVRGQMAQTSSDAGQEAGALIGASVGGANPAGMAAGRLGGNVVSRLAGNSRQKLREVLLPDGYPVLITTDAASQSQF